MAISVEDANLAWQRADIAAASLGLKGGVQATLKALKAYLSQAKNNPQLQFVAISDLGADAVIADAACKVYALVLKKGATATGAFVKAADHATSAGTTASDLVRELNAAGQQTAIIDFEGWAQGTGFTVGSDTTADGSTASTAGDGPSGFALIGNP